MERNTLKSFENLCNIFEMRIKLDREKSIDTPEDVLINYEKYAKKIDTIYNSDFEKEIKSLISPAATLEKEEERLKKLIELLDDRIEKREELENKFYLITGKRINGLQLVVSEAELNQKRERLNIVSRYLHVKEETENLTESIGKIKNSLSELLEKKNEYNNKNKIIEDELYSMFIECISSDSYFNSINEDNLESEIVKVLNNVKETKETLDVTRESVNSLIGSFDTDDYSSYIIDAEKNYFIWKNRELILKIYEIVMKFKDDFNDILDKRKNIDYLIKERRRICSELNITTSDELKNFEDLLKNQQITLNNEKEILESISNYNNRIKFKEERLEQLENEINSVEILAILREYGLIEIYENEEIPSSIEEENIPEEEATLEEKLGETTISSEDAIILETIDPYRIVEVNDAPATLNIGLAKLKGASVRDKVNKKLNPKKTFEDLINTINSDTPKENINEITTIEDKITSSEEKTQDKEESTSNNIKLEENTNSFDNIPINNSLPTWDAPKEESPIKSVNIPIKEIVKEDNTNSFDNIPINNSLPTWDAPKEEVPTKSENVPIKEQAKEKNIPIWGDIKPIIEDEKEKAFNEEIASLDIKAKEDNTTSNDMFWVPVSNSKLDTGSFPNIEKLFGSNEENNNNDFPSL